MWASLAVMGIDRRRAIIFRLVSLNDAHEIAAEAKPLRCRIQMATVYFKGKVNKLYSLPMCIRFVMIVTTHCHWLLAKSQRDHTCLQVPRFSVPMEGVTHTYIVMEKILLDIFKQLVLFKYRSRVWKVRTNRPTEDM